VSQDEAAKQVAKLVYETALVESGFILEDPKDFATRVYSVVRSTLNVSPDAEIEKEELQTTTEETDNMQEQEQDEVRDAICSCCSALALRRIPN
jgi:heat shock protein beta